MPKEIKPSPKQKWGCQGDLLSGANILERWNFKHKHQRAEIEAEELCTQLGGPLIRERFGKPAEHRADLPWSLVWEECVKQWGSRQVRICWTLSPRRRRVIQSLAAFQGFQFSSVAQSCRTLCNPKNRSTPGLPVHHQLPESTQTHIHRVSNAIQPSHPLLSPSPALNPSQHQSLFQ